ncbi:MAG: MmgE/PrpD family protein [Terracidiphilus sp.]
MSDDLSPLAPALHWSRRHFLACSALFSAAPAMLSASMPSTQAAAPVTRILSEWLAQSKPADIPADARKEAVRSIVNWLGVTLGGSSQPAVAIALQTLAPFQPVSGAALFARAERPDALRAALINGISSHVLDFDDTDLRTIIHPAGPVASALFALCQIHPLTGAEFLHAFVLGVEIECRLGLAIYPSHYDMGWHITGTCGTFGAAAACAKALALDATGIQMALGIAATEAAGLKVTFGSMSKSLNIGRAAENGMFAALLAARGFTAAPDSLEGKGGYILAASTMHQDEALIQCLGQAYAIRRNTYKPFACGIVLHPAIDAVLQLRKQFHISPQSVESITVHANPQVLQLTGKAHPRDGLESKFSVYHAVAAALVLGYAGTAEFSDAAVGNPAVASLRQRVKVVTDPAIRTDEATVAILSSDGRTFEKHIDHAIGSLDRPLTDAELNEKYRRLAEGILPSAQSEKLLALAWNLEQSADVAALPRLAAPPNSSAPEARS